MWRASVIKMGVANVDAIHVHVSSHLKHRLWRSLCALWRYKLLISTVCLKEELAWAVDKWVWLISTVLLFKSSKSTNKELKGTKE